MARFTLKILNPKHVVRQGDAESVFLPGTAGEFELLAFHAPIVSLLQQGEIVVDWKERIPIKKGMVRFSDGECVILLDEQQATRKAKTAHG